MKPINHRISNPLLADKNVMFTNVDCDSMINHAMTLAKEVVVFCSQEEKARFTHPFVPKNVKAIVGYPVVIQKEYSPRLFDRFDLVVNYRAPTLGCADVSSLAFLHFIEHGGQLLEVTATRHGIEEVIFDSHGNPRLKEPMQ
jgi:hypothetical protein